MKPRRIPIGSIAHVYLQFFNIDPLPISDFVGIRYDRSVIHITPEDRHMLMLHAPSTRIFRAVDERTLRRQRAGESEFFPQSTLTRSGSVFADERMATAGVRPEERPEHFLAASLLDQHIGSVFAKHIDGERAVELSLTRMSVNDVCLTDCLITFIDENDGAVHS